MDRHALVPPARDDKQGCDFSGLTPQTVDPSPLALAARSIWLAAEEGECGDHGLSGDSGSTVSAERSELLLNASMRGMRRG